MVRPLKGDWMQALDAYDAVLLSRDTSSTIDASRFAVIDVIDEWYDLTLLPFVRELFLGWNDKIESGHEALVGTPETLRIVRRWMTCRNGKMK